MNLPDFITANGFDPFNYPNVVIDSSNGDERDELIIAVREGRFISVGNNDVVYEGWKYWSHIVHRCYAPWKVML